MGAAGEVMGVAGAGGVEGEAGNTVGCVVLRDQSVIPPLREEGAEVKGKLGTGSGGKGQERRERRCERGRKTRKG
jgi:hypothetical protein